MRRRFRRSSRHGRFALPPARRIVLGSRGQSTIEYTLLVAAFAVPFSYAVFFAFFEPRPGRLVEFLTRILDFVKY